MLRKILGVVVLLALPALLAAQRPSTPAAAAQPAVTHGIAMHVQGEVASPVEEMDGQNNQEGVHEVDGQNNDGQNDDGQVDNDDGQVDQEGVDEPDNDVDAGEQVDQAGENEDDDPPAPPSGASQLSRIGRHKP